jgi:hypothetical protein
MFLRLSNKAAVAVRAVRTSISPCVTQAHNSCPVGPQYRGVKGQERRTRER